MAALLGTERLVTVVGPAGVGKTRLAQEVALGHSAWGGGSRLRRQGQVLLVLHGAEHVASATRDLAIALLEAAPMLRVLVTSRRSLDVSGERVLRLELLTDASSLQLLTSALEPSGASGDAVGGCAGRANVQPGGTRGQARVG